MSVITVPPPMSLSAGAGVAMLGLYAAVSLILVLWSMVARDA